MRVLVTRARDDADRTARRLAAAGHDALIAPLIEIVPTGAAMPGEVFDAILATSVHAIASLEHLPPTLAGAPWLVVGQRLAAALGARGWGSPEIAARDAAELLAGVDARYPGPFRFLYLAGRDRKPDLEETLRARGHEVIVVESYAAQAARLDATTAERLMRGELDAALHFSRRSAELFVQAVHASGCAATVANFRHIAISADAAEPLLAQDWRVEVAEQPNEAAMLEALR